MIVSQSNIIAIIPARAGSRRLPHKNRYKCAGLPMIGHALEACNGSKHDIEVMVSTDDEGIMRYCMELKDVDFFRRPDFLCEDSVPKHTVVQHAMGCVEGIHLKKGMGGIVPEICISIQPNSPEISSRHLDDAIRIFRLYNLSELMSVGVDHLGNGAFRVMKWEYARQQSVSTNFGVYVCDLIDVHTKADVERVEKRWNS
jgi:CMP-N,N'-diacetyllegionaminic acid synthase